MTVALAMTIHAVAPAVPEIQRRFGVDDGDAGWFTLAYVLPGVFLTIPLGTLLARAPRRLAVAGSLTLYAAAGAAQALAGDYGTLLALRLLQGAAFAAAMPLTVVIVGDAYRGLAQVRAFAARQVVSTAAEFALPLIGIALVALSWRGPFVAQAAIALVAAAALVTLDDRRSARPARGDGRSTWRAVRAQPCGTAVLAVGFARMLFKFALLAYLPALLVRGGAADAAGAGVVLALAAGAAGVAAAFVPRALRRLPAARMTCAALLVVAGALAAFPLAGDLPAACAVAVAFGVGDGVLAVMQDAYVTRTWPEGARAQPAAASQSARNLGKAAAPLAVAALLTTTSLTVAFCVLAGAAALLACALRSLRALDRRFAPGPTPPARAA
nr:MFS transporter [Conexibacter arvalis]